MFYMMQSKVYKLPLHFHYFPSCELYSDDRGSQCLFLMKKISYKGLLLQSKHKNYTFSSAL